MLTLPEAILPVLIPFATLFRSPTPKSCWLGRSPYHGTERRRNYARYHHVLNRADAPPLGLLINRRSNAVRATFKARAGFPCRWARSPAGRLGLALSHRAGALRYHRRHKKLTVGQRGESLTPAALWTCSTAANRWLNPLPSESRPRMLKGRRLPALKTLLRLPTVEGAPKSLGLTCKRRNPGRPPVPLIWVLVRDPQGEFTPQALLCTETRRRSWNGLCCAGNWRSPSRRCGRIWAWRPSASGRIRPSLAPRRS